MLGGRVERGDGTAWPVGEYELASRMSEVERVDLRYHKGVAVAYRELPPQEDKTDKEKA